MSDGLTHLDCKVIFNTRVKVKVSKALTGATVGISTIHEFLPDMQGYRLISSESDEKCKCVEEEWECPIGIMSFHLLPSGRALVFFDTGDCEWETEITGDGVDGFWQSLITYIDTLPVLDD